ncbi:MAG: SRPBCC family protein [Phenylobacterium sp.]|uniref:SRPBCC family protein n=1 Tax=Phenylobacterium sp. TaxID=1871053 RepID=UPI002721B443|nr:SRPBCC family protein [Phenylobacterium sp.]MDO9433166.1 SRPBCC family protein [Phenylobacterium sp.]
MTERSVSHATFVIERAYDAAPARVFAAWASPEAKSLWFGNLAKPDPGYQLDFRVGGRELNKGGPEGGAVYTYDGVYLEIVPDQRIALSYTMDMDQTRISVSIATVELKADGGRTRLIYTEQGAYFDGHDKPEFREHGTKELLNNLAAYLAR